MGQNQAGAAIIPIERSRFNSSKRQLFGPTSKQKSNQVIIYLTFSTPH